MIGDQNDFEVHTIPNKVKKYKYLAVTANDSYHIRRTFIINNIHGSIVSLIDNKRYASL